MPITAQEMLQGTRALEKELRRKGQHSGPTFSDKGKPVAWWDQYFEREIDPTGIINCEQALRVGSTMQRLDVVILASYGNGGPLNIPGGSTITLTLMQGDDEEGTFTDVGPTVCVKAPPEGMQVDEDEIVCRFPVGDFTKPWLKVTLEFAGAITGGNVDCALGFIPA